MKKRLHAIVSGRVQGVGYRSFVMTHAIARNLTGWVRNLYSGEVELIAEGDETILALLLSDLQQGPRNSRVTDIRIEWFSATGNYPSFEVLPSWVSD